MEFLSEVAGSDEGILRIQAAGFAGSHRRATGSFGFVLTQDGRSTKVRDWIQVLRAHPSQQQRLGPMRGDLTVFDFTEQYVPGALMPEQMDGCRDWIAQAFTRFYIAGLVTLCGQELEQTPALYSGNQVTYLNFNQLIPSRANSVQPAPFWFPDIIDKNFVMTRTPQHPYGVTVQSLPMHRGTFHDRLVVRQETVTVFNRDGSQTYTFRYNYHNRSRPGSASGGPGGPPPPQPPGGGNGGFGPSYYFPPGGNGAGGSTGGPSYVNPGGPPPPGAGAGQAGWNQAGSGAPSSRKPKPSKKPAPTVAPALVDVMYKGKYRGRCDKNAKPDKKGRVPVYLDNKPNGLFHPKTEEYYRSGA